MTCERCAGQGYVLEEGNVARVCEECRGPARIRCELVERRMETVPMRYRGCSRESWRGAWPVPAEWSSWPAEAGSDPWLLLILGEATGIGKTHVATALFRELLDRGVLGWWIAVRPALQVLQEAIDGTEEQRAIAAEIRERRLQSQELVLLDDVGRERSTPWSIDLLSGVLEYRHAWQLPTIVTSNAASVETLAGSYGQRVGSRIAQGSLVCILDGQDRRLT